MWCGESKKHNEICPVVAGIPDGALGMTPVNEDAEWNMNLGRMKILFSFTKKGFGTLNKKVNKQLAIETAKFFLLRGASVKEIFDMVHLFGITKKELAKMKAEIERFIL